MDQRDERHQIDATSAIPVTDGFTGPQSSINTNNTEIPVGSAALVVVKGPQLGDVFVLRPGENLIGRGDDTQLMLDDVTVSRNHATINKINSDWIIKDLESLNGTYVNRTRISELKLNGGEELQIGKYRFAFLLPTTEEK